ncbi:restriction endonuclease subunit S [Arthrobacter rhombi]|uniref:Type I restriction-modification system, specificity subunit S n=1 Tax=Arthrobacter rhombi TaxID=71253 RepID=A0A1R4FPR8_9MICC|nr:restriction endonuclease subunit S [Arthrobacter rhombi]SJM57916.1 Type I restriction-modification system, specificity subunit S [Arthrobacter rhombi]
MSLKPYPEYINSGTEWLGEIPATWSVSPVKHLAHLLAGGTPESDNLRYWTNDGGINWVAIGDMSSRDLVHSTARQITQEGQRTKSLPVAPPSTVLFAMYASVGEVSILGIHAAWNQALLGFRVNSSRANSKFLFYALKAVSKWLPVFYRRNTQNNLNAEQVGNLRLPLPPLPEQSMIIDYLDRETAEIDAFIADQEQLISLLSERRTATITHAVTKGLNPNTRMKDSGASWLGELPSHWSITKIKYLGDIKYGLGEPPVYCEEGVPLIRATNVSAGTITPQKLVYVNPEDIPASKIFWLRNGDIIVVRSGALTGDSAIIPLQYEGSIAGFDMVFRANKTTDPNFVQYTLLAPYVKSAQIDQIRIRAAQPHLNSEELGDCLITTPPYAEQNAISDYLERETGEIDAAMAEAREAIALSKERRAAMISAAVTGKIDVRGMGPSANVGEAVSVGVA